jgi:hypothetical protein
MKQEMLDIIERKIGTCREFNIAETYALLKSEGPRFWSWGGQNFNNYKNKAFIFKVNGHHHKGIVIIFLNSLDLYNVYLIEKDGTLKEELIDLYYDRLFDAIDVKVEKIAAYTR